MTEKTNEASDWIRSLIESSTDKTEVNFPQGTVTITCVRCGLVVKETHRVGGFPPVIGEIPDVSIYDTCPECEEKTTP